MTFSLIKELFQTCINNDFPYKRLTFSPDIEGYSSNFLFSREGEGLEIIIFKSTMKKIFKESHEKLETILPFDNGELIIL